MMSPYSEGPRRSMVSSLAAGMPTSQAARTFSVSLSSVKHYAHSAERGKSLAPKKRSGAAPKLDEKVRKLWQDLKERHGPHGSHQERGSVSPGAWRHRARRILEEGMAGDGGSIGRAREVRLRGRVCSLGRPRWRHSTATRPKVSACAFVCRASFAGARTQPCCSLA
jgi:transposase